MPDPRVAHPARTYDYLLGGKDNYSADRELIEKNLQIMPEAPVRVRANRLFLERAVRYLVSEAGIRQILDIGAGMPSPLLDNVHEIAQRIAPETRVVYVDSNPTVVAHIRALMADGEQVAAFHGDLRDPGSIIHHPVTQAMLDLTQPVGVVLGGIVHFIPDEADPARILTRLRDAMAPDSHIVITHISGDLDSRVQDVTRLFAQSAAPMVARSRAQLEELLGGFELVAPGLVPVHEWRPDRIIRETGDAYGMVARRK